MIVRVARGRMAPFRRVALLGLGMVGLIALLVAIAVCALLWTPWGHRVVCSWVNRAITDGIAGKLEVAGIDELSLSHVRAHDIRILAPDGKPAIEAARAAIDFDLLALFFSQRAGWSRAEIEDCHVRVSEDGAGKLNMEETFKKRRAPEQPAASSGTKEDGSELDLRTMVTSRCRLDIFGGSLPTLRMVDLHGIMRVRVPPSGDAELRFDGYRGRFTHGLPMGELAFREVAGEVTSGQKRLLHFMGRGKNKGSELSFELAITRQPTRVRIDATFPKVSAASIASATVEAWSKFSKSIELRVHRTD